MNRAVEPPYEYKVGGSLVPNDPTYIERKADHELYEAAKKREFSYVLNARQMGKSSLIIKTLKRLEEKGFKCVYIDISLLGDRNTSSEEWYFGLIQRLNTTFQINNIYSWWDFNRSLSPIDRFRLFISDILLKNEREYIVIFFDEIDSIIKFDFKDDFFTSIRGFYQARSNDSKYNRLTFIISGVASPNDLMSNKSQTPFNIGEAIELEGFTLQETKPLWKGLTHKVDDPEAVMKEILDWTGGQPFLTQKVCKLIQQDHNKIHLKGEKHYINYLIQWKIIEHWQSQDHPQHLRTIHQRLTHIKNHSSFFSKHDKDSIFNGLLIGSTSEELELRLSGLMVKRNNKLEVYNKIYKNVFSDTLDEFCQDNKSSESFQESKLNNFLQTSKLNKLKKINWNIIYYASVVIGVFSTLFIIFIIIYQVFIQHIPLNNQKNNSSSSLVMNSEI